MYLRNIEKRLTAALADTRVVLLNGARQTGKSTLALRIVEQTNATYVNLDDAATLSLAVSDPRGFIRGMDDRLVIDEVQRAPELFPEIKMEVDADPRPGRFLLTGSANVLLLPQLSEFLTGRIEIITLWPLSQGEIEGKQESFIDIIFSEKRFRIKNVRTSRMDIAERILRGGYPEAIAREDSGRRRDWFGSYITTLLQRDIRDLSHIDRMADVPRLLTLLAGRTGGLLNMSELSRSTGIAFSTLRRYLGLLQATFLLQLVPAWSTNLSKRLVKSPKIYLLDCGLAAYLIGQSDPKAFQESAHFGHLLESFVAMELQKQLGWNQLACRMFHFRSSSGREVDFVLEALSGKIVGIEVKASSKVNHTDFAGLESLAEIAGKKFVRGVVFYLGDSLLPFGEKYSAIPLSLLWEGVKSGR